MEEAKARCSVVEHGQKMNALGINQGTSGNLSLRFGGGLLITPSGIPYDEMTPEDVVFVRMDGSYEGKLAPSSEWRFHRDIMAPRPEVTAVVHAHPAHCTALSIVGRGIPAVHYMIAAALGEIRVAPYATFGTEELSKNALEALKGRFACLLAHHGMIALGPTLPRALWLANEVETIARQYTIALQIGEPKVLPEDEIGRLIGQFQSYAVKDKSKENPGEDSSENAV
jgi:L-fuculose-phosphate aldolase